MESKPGEGYITSSFDEWAGNSVPNPPGIAPARPEQVTAMRAEIEALRSALTDALMWCPKCKGKRTHRGRPCHDCLALVQVLAKGSGS